MALRSKLVGVEANSWMGAKISLVIFGINIFACDKDAIIWIYSLPSPQDQQRVK